MNDNLEKDYAEKIQKEQLQPADTSIWYFPHHPVTNPAKPEKVRMVFDCAATYQNTSLNQQLLQGPDRTNQLVGVLTRFRQERIGLVSDIESMFHQVLVEPRDCDPLRFFWWPNPNLSGEMKNIVWLDACLVQHPNQVWRTSVSERLRITIRMNSTPAY